MIASKTILILGSTSLIGAELSKKFSQHNKIILAGRNCFKLSRLAEECKKLNPVDIKIVATDFTWSIAPILEISKEWPVDLVIDAASASSSYRDSSVTYSCIRDLISADINSHLDLLKELENLNKKHPDVIFISTALSEIKTPDREIYSATKRILELYLKKARLANLDLKVLIFRIGKVVDKKNGQKNAEKIAANLWRVWQTDKYIKAYGFGGNIMKIVYSIHPVLLKILVIAQRKLR